MLKNAYDDYDAICCCYAAAVVTGKPVLVVSLYFL